MRILVLAAVALAALASCSEHRPRCEAYHFHKTFPVAYQASARVAVERWSEFSGHALPLEDGDPNDAACSFRAIDFDSAEYASLKAAMGTDFYAVHLPDDGSVAIAEGAWPDVSTCEEDRRTYVTGLLMHETAHEFGLMHVADPDAVMGVSSPVRPLVYVAADRAECARVGACD